MAVLLLVLSSVYGVLNVSTRNLRTTEAQADLTQTARVVLGDLRRELGSVYPMWVPLDDEQRAELQVEAPEEGVVSFAGEDGEDDQGRPNDNVRFTAAVIGANRGGAPRSDIAELMYSIDQDEETPEAGLIRQANYRPGLSVDEEPELETTEITRLATSLQIQYWAGDDETALEQDPDGDGWLDGWNDPAKLPSAVKITLGLTPPPGKSRAQAEPDERLYTMIARVPIRAPRQDLRPEDEQVGLPTAGADGATPDPEAGGELPTPDLGALGDALGGGPGGGGGQALPAPGGGR